MNLLPKRHTEFGEKEYWDKFFKKRGSKAFEWYGEYLELCSHLHKYIKQKDDILVTGCGNSSLSADLYDAGFTKITNIDVSDVVIRRMKSQNSKRNEMKFLEMDATNMAFENGAFSVVLDKGTLDALMPDESEQTMEVVNKYFAEIGRVLKFGGRYVCISLLQEQILKKMLSSFCNNSWMFRVVRCHDVDKRNADNADGKIWPVFVIVATKFSALPQLVLEVCMGGDKMQRLQTPDEVQRCVQSTQEVSLVISGLSKVTLTEDEEVSLELCEPGSETPRYVLYIMENPLKRLNKKYAVFVVPQGRETEWLFNSQAGRRQLQVSAGFARLVVATTVRGQLYQDLAAVTEELGHAAQMLAPRGHFGQIPFLSIGNDVGSRVTVFKGSSQCTGDFVVEDVDVSGDTFRRLIFLDNQFLVQSEAKLKPARKDGQARNFVDYGHVSLYHACMMIGLELNELGGGPTKAAVLGLGGGGLCMFLRKYLPRLAITAVELDTTMFELAKSHFGLKIDDQLKVQIKDGVDFLREEAVKGKQYDVIMFDMDSKDKTMGLSCPPQQFLKNDALDDVKRLLSHQGHFILNLVCPDNKLCSTIMSTLQEHFRYIVSFAFVGEVNKVIFATNSDQSYSMELIEQATKNLNKNARDAKLVSVKCVDLTDILESAVIVC